MSRFCLSGSLHRRGLEGYRRSARDKELIRMAMRCHSEYVLFAWSNPVLCATTSFFLSDAPVMTYTSCTGSEVNLFYALPD